MFVVKDGSCVWCRAALRGNFAVCVLVVACDAVVGWYIYIAMVTDTDDISTGRASPSPTICIVGMLHVMPWLAATLLVITFANSNHLNNNNLLQNHLVAIKPLHKH